MDSAIFWVSSSLRVPGLGLLVLPAAPPPAWLAAYELHTALRLRLHCPGQLPLVLPATIEELASTGQVPCRALLLDADPAGATQAGAWLELLVVAPDGLLY